MHAFRCYCVSLSIIQCHRFVLVHPSRVRCVSSNELIPFTVFQFVLDSISLLMTDNVAFLFVIVAFCVWLRVRSLHPTKVNPWNMTNKQKEKKKILGMSFLPLLSSRLLPFVCLENENFRTSRCEKEMPWNVCRMDIWGKYQLGFKNTPEVIQVSSKETQFIITWERRRKINSCFQYPISTNWKPTWLRCGRIFFFNELADHRLYFIYVFVEYDSLVWVLWKIKTIISRFSCLRHWLWTYCHCINFFSCRIPHT